jgi:predicted enzyme related to lactoylglutathione lyase
MFFTFGSPGTQPTMSAMIVLLAGIRNQDILIRPSFFRPRMDRVTAFNIPAKDMGRACEFYRQVFGWEIGPVKGSSGGYHAAVTTPTDKEGIPIARGAINGGLFENATHGIETVFLEIEVDSIDSTVGKVNAQGGRLVREKRPMLDFGFFAVVQDPDGNYLGLMEYGKP